MSNALRFLRDVNICPISRIYYPILIKISIRDLHVMLLGICEFRENWRSEGRTFLMGVSFITFARVP